ncbi:dirigent protein 22 [Amborella trichopoda]|uniref:Dirigent protein n=1 Tax=Amborella trichopoda TaxID=13333 RepID=W1PTP3_AMBTC|nr:dirigent protein 22 [Amborella trichopoda]ERN13407.1 hypothetical protein AMTR_s00041p00179310 [Amborella trichopoda]|eukprot:XP_006851940.3 dirigent protein 22 [Amborella trichopoda]
MRGAPTMAFALLLLFFMDIATSKSDDWRERQGIGQPKVSHLHFYFQGVLTGPNPTSVLVAELNSTQASPTSFGSIYVHDDLLTEGPNLTSKLIGTVQGIEVVSSQTELSVTMALNFVFTGGEFNGSTLTVVGRNPILQDVREMPVVGGNGVLRLAQGYALLRTISFDAAAVTVEYNVTVIHC